MNKQELLRHIPSMDALLNDESMLPLYQDYSRSVIKDCCQVVLDETRANIDKGPQRTREQWIVDIVAGVKEKLGQEFGSSLVPVINATGIVLHTGLGRAPLSESARHNVGAVIEGYSNLELNMFDGKRGNRNKHVEKLICKLTGAEAAVVVNNNAAAVFITLNTVAFGKKAIISRGQLVEIGGSFRIPDVMEKSGAIMVEVGTTNKTKIADYQKAISAETGAIVVAHTSNYRIMGFTAEVEIAELAALGKKSKIPVVHDLGGGVMLDLQDYGLPYEPLVQDSLQQGADIVTFSGDKILGGPQSGIIAGKKEWIKQIADNPIMRAVRCDKMTFAALEATLQLYLNTEKLQTQHQVLRMLTEDVNVVKKRAKLLLGKLEIKDGYEINIESSNAQTGSGALPLEIIKSAALTITVKDGSVEKLAAKLRTGTTPVVGYVKNEKLFLDMRTVLDHQVPCLAEVMNQAL